jgi:hypothetical protein
MRGPRNRTRARRRGSQIGHEGSDDAERRWCLTVRAKQQALHMCTRCGEWSTSRYRLAHRRSWIVARSCVMQITRESRRSSVVPPRVVPKGAAILIGRPRACSRMDQRSRGDGWSLSCPRAPRQPGECGACDERSSGSSSSVSARPESAGGFRARPTRSSSAAPGTLCWPAEHHPRGARGRDLRPVPARWSARPP